MKNLYRLNEKHKNQAIVGRWPDTELEDKSDFLGFFQRSKVLLYLFVINAEKLIVLAVM